MRKILQLVALALLAVGFFSTTLQAQCISGTTVSLFGGGTDVVTCPGDGNPDLLRFRTSQSGTPFAFLVTDESNTILAVSVNDQIDFENAGVGVCRVWAFSFAGNILAEPGQDAANTPLASICYELTDNFVTVTRTVPDGGDLTTTGGATTAYTCPGDGNPDVVQFFTTSPSPQYAYIITDENNVILAIADGDSFDFEAAPEGICRVWGLAYAGNIIAQVGDDAANSILADDCFGLSNNFLEVVRSVPDGGTVSLPNGETETLVCVNDGSPDLLEFINQTSSSALYTYVITDDNNIILALPGGNSADFDGAGAGICRVWGLSYTGNILANIGDDAAAIALTDDCFDLSDNFITVNRFETDGATVSLEDGATETRVCTSDGQADVLTFINTSTVSANYLYVVTDENNIILATSEDGIIDFEGAGAGICRVWGLSFTGTLLANAGDDAAAIALSDECFDLSDNFVTIDRRDVDGGTVALEDGTTETLVCVNDGVADELTVTNTSSIDDTYVYVVTDDNNNVLAISEGATIDFDGAGPGICRIWGLSFTGNLLVQVGDNAAAVDLSDECFDLSDNFVTVVRNEVDGGTVSLENGETSIIICVNDGVSDELSFVNTSTTPENYIYVVTDENNIILATSEDGIIDFEGAGIGICRVWGLAFTGSLLANAGDDAAAIALSDECYELSENFVTVDRRDVDGGTVALESGETEGLACVGDGISDDFNFENTSTSNADYVYVITDDNNIILAVTNENSADFEGAGTGICRVWGLSFTGNLIAVEGDDAAAVALSDECFDLSDNFITITRKEVDGGSVALENGETAITVCVGDGISDELTLINSSTSAEEYVYVITDDQNNILAIEEGNSADFEGAGTGICRVWGLSFTGNLIAQIGDNAAAVSLSDECFELSENFIEVTRKEVDGGMVTLIDMETEVSICVGDNQTDNITVVNTSTASESYIYVITDEDNIILALTEENTISFADVAPGICRIWGLSYSGNLLANLGDDAAAVSLSDECFELSENFIQVNRELVEGGSVSLENGDTEIVVCSGDNEDDLLTFITDTDATVNYAFVITDDQNTILVILDGNTVDFNIAAPGTCRVWGLSYTGNIIAGVGDNASQINFSDDCFDLSDNFVVVTRVNVAGGSVATSEGLTELLICPGDGNADVIDFETTSTAGSNYAYLITDENNILLQEPVDASFDFDTVEEGVCRVWGLSYSGNLNIQIGDDAAAIALSDECFELSSNFILITKDAPEGGTVAMPSGETVRYTCPGDGIPDIVMFDSTGASNVLYTYIVTDDNNNILAFPAGDSFDFDGAPAGICRVWGLAYTGNLTAEAGDNAAAVQLSDDCFDLSENFIEVIREVPEGGTVQMPNGNTEVFTCPGDGTPDLVMFDSLGTSNSPYIYVITDENNIILGLADGDSFDFEEAPEGICRVWGLAYTGNIIANLGDDAAAVALTDDCFDLSDNFIEVVRSQPDAGVITAQNEQTSLEFCVGDGNPDIIDFIVQGASSANYVYLLTDENDFLIGTLTESSFNFENATVNHIRVYGLSYTGNLGIFPGDNINDVALSTGCFDLTDGFIDLTLISVDGGVLTTTFEDDTIFVCSEDGVDDFIPFFTTSSATGANYDFVITDLNDVILATINGNLQNFEGFFLNSCRVWGISYTGNATYMPGDALSGELSDSCYVVSDNFITIIKDLPEGGEVTTSDGDTSVLLCIGTGDNSLDFVTTSTSISGYQYIVTDENNVVLALPEGDNVDFSAAGPGVCRVWGLSYTGNLEIEAGQMVDTTVLASSCFELSSNFVEVVRSIQLDGGNISTIDGTTSVYTCPGDEVPDLVTFTTTSISDANYRYVITDDNNFIISADIEEDVIDFDPADPGVCRIWGVSFTGTLTAMANNDITTAMLSDSCFEISANFITVVRANPEGGTVSTLDGETEVTVVVGDGEADLIEFTNADASLAQYIYVITDDNNNILALTETGEADFEGAGLGVCRIWGLSYTGNIIANVGDNAGEVPLTDDCFDLSDNFITVNRVSQLINDEIELLTQAGIEPTPSIREIQIAPNPAGEYINLNFVLSENAAILPASTITILNTSGEILINDQIPTNSGVNQNELTINQLVPGFYLIVLTNGEEIFYGKFLKQ